MKLENIYASTLSSDMIQIFGGEGHLEGWVRTLLNRILKKKIPVESKKGVLLSHRPFSPYKYLVRVPY